MAEQLRKMPVSRHKSPLFVIKFAHLHGFSLNRPPEPAGLIGPNFGALKRLFPTQFNLNCQTFALREDAGLHMED